MGKMLIYRYLPQKLIPEKVDELELDDFFRYVAMAQYMRDLNIDDIASGVSKAILAAFGEDG